MNLNRSLKIAALTSVMSLSAVFSAEAAVVGAFDTGNLNVSGHNPAFSERDCYEMGRVIVRSRADLLVMQNVRNDNSMNALRTAEMKEEVVKGSGILTNTRIKVNQSFVKEWAFQGIPFERRAVPQTSARKPQSVNGQRVPMHDGPGSVLQLKTGAHYFFWNPENVSLLGRPEQLKLSAFDGGDFPMLARFMDNASGRKFTVVSLNLEEGETSRDKEKRSERLTSLSDWLDGKKGPVIIAGNFGTCTPETEGAGFHILSEGSLDDRRSGVSVKGSGVGHFTFKSNAKMKPGAPAPVGQKGHSAAKAPVHKEPVMLAEANFRPGELRDFRISESHLMNREVTRKKGQFPKYDIVTVQVF